MTAEHTGRRIREVELGDVTVTLSDFGDGLDTMVNLSGHVWIAGEDRDKFIERLRRFLDFYSI